LTRRGGSSPKLSEAEAREFLASGSSDLVLVRAALGVGAAAERRADPAAVAEAHYTPPELVEAVLDLVRLREGDLVLEPHAGGGAFARGLLARGARVLLGDLREDADALQIRDHRVRTLPAGDFADRTSPLRLALQKMARPSWVIGNPPFGPAPDHVRAALEVADRVAFVLPVTHLAASERADLLEVHPISDFWTLVPRPSFDRGGTARSECMIAIWTRGEHGPSRFHGPLRWERAPLSSTRDLLPGGKRGTP
jgi:predicted RNA methylase